MTSTNHLDRRRRESHRRGWASAPIREGGRSNNGAPPELFLESTTDTSADFTGEFGNSYTFFSVATDNVGLREPPPAVADTQTMSIIGAWVNPRNVFDINDRDGVTALEVR